MANNRIINMDIKQILRLYDEGKSQRFISRELKLHRNAVHKYIVLCKGMDKPLSELLELDDGSFNKLFPLKVAAKSDQQIELENYLKSCTNEHKHVGFTVENLFQDYVSLYPDGLCRSQFYMHYNVMYKAPKGSLKIDHCYGQKLFIDFTGKHLHIVDKATGELMAVEVFVGILPASQYVFVKAVMSQSLTDFTLATTSCLDYIGGVPQSITTDNLKAAVNKASKTEPVLNKSFKDLAHHYRTTITPTRAYSPKDKAMVEGAVRIVYCSIFYKLRHRLFYDLDSLNNAISEELATLNTRKLSNREVSRHDQFIEEQKTLKPLPISPFTLWDYKQVRVQKMGYIFCSKYKNYYSIPYRFIGKQIQIRTNATCLQACYEGDIIATHLLNRKPGVYTTIKEHLHSDNQFYAQWSPMFFADMAKKIGDYTEQYVSKMIAESEYPETSYRSALAIINLKRLYCVQRIEAACKLAMDYAKKNCGVLQTILENNRDSIPTQTHHVPSASSIIHANVRGTAYYSTIN
jgi:transposase